MAEPLTRAGALAVLEDAVHLLRRAGFLTLVLHWTGSVPLAVATLVFWNALTHGRPSDSVCAAAALLMAVLLAWMNSWRAVFAGALRRELSGAAAGWTRDRVWRLVAGQSLLGATKPIVLLLSALVIFPFAKTVAFFRYAAVLADREDLDPAQAISRARRLADFDERQSWMLLPVLVLLGLVSAANLALAMAFLPQLVKMLTGYESVFSRSGASFYESPLFFVLVVLVTWVMFDPFVQAVYCVRCFRGESMETGEDVRSGLRRIAAAGKAMAALLLAAICARAGDAVSPGELERSIRQTMESSEYAWRIPPPKSAPGGTPWIVAATDRIIAALKSVVHAIGDAIGKVLKWFLKQIIGQPQSLGGAAPATALHWSLYLLIAVLVAAAVWLAWRSDLFRRRKSEPADEAATAVRLDEEGLTADRLPEEQWLELGEQSLAREEFRLALRAFYLANLAWLGASGMVAIHPGKTNREYEVELRRRARPAAEARELFARNIVEFERAWYGMHEVSREGVEEFRGRAARMKAALAPLMEGAAA